MNYNQLQIAASSQLVAWFSKAMWLLIADLFNSDVVSFCVTLGYFLVFNFVYILLVFDNLLQGAHIQGVVLP